MVFRGSPVCLKCESSESPLWTNAENLGAVCLNCVNEAKKDDSGEDAITRDDSKAQKRKCRTRTYKTRLHASSAPKEESKGRGRRSIFKRIPMKAPQAVATPVTSDSVFYRGSYFQVGDIVSLADEEQNSYYAQIRGFLTDQYCQKSAAISWLLPTLSSPPPNEVFDSATYVLGNFFQCDKLEFNPQKFQKDISRRGPDEELTRNLDCMEFIMHAPSDYYKSRETPYPKVVSSTLDKGYVWTNIEPIMR